MAKINEDFVEESIASSSFSSDSSRQGDDTESSDKRGSGSDRQLRHRRLNLNKLASSLTCPLVCKVQHCGIQLKDGDSLNWHYEGHLAQEISRLERGVRVKKNANDFPDRSSRLRVRMSCAKAIRFRREARQAMAMSTRKSAAVRCPVCQEHVADTEEELSSHVEACLRVAPPSPLRNDGEGAVEPDEEIDVDGGVNFESYEWAGQVRTRATALFEGGLRGAGFLTITQGDEDQELDIENDEEQAFGPNQFSDADIIPPRAESSKEEVERQRLREAALGVKAPASRPAVEAAGAEEEHLDGSNEKCVEALRREVDELKRKSMCTVCMDTYASPLVSVKCWHVHCSTCWLQALGCRKVCPQCKVITSGQDLRRIYL